MKKKFFLETLCHFLLSVRASFDYEEKEVYRFSLIAVDNGRTPRRSEPSDVTIEITNLNDEYPIFEEQSYSQ